MGSRPETTGGRISLMLGLPVGTAAVVGALALTAWVSHDSLFRVYVRFFGDATAWLLVVFPFALWAAGATMARDIVDGRAARVVCRRYTLSVNIAIWLTYVLVSAITTTAAVNGVTFLLSTVALPVTLFLLSVAITPSTLARALYGIVQRALTTR